MFKAILLLGLALSAVASAQEAAEQNAAPEPYAYGYQTDTHSASEQRSADGKVTGYYTIVDPTDGRERRVEYVADENGFRAKVATNELGTKQENPADVEVLASPPTEAQLASAVEQQQQQQQQSAYSKQQFASFQQQQPQFQQSAFNKQQFVSYQQQQPQLQRSVTTTTVQQSPAAVGYRYVQQPGLVGGYGYYPGSQYGYQYGQGALYNQAGYGQALYNKQAQYGLAGGIHNYYTPGQYYSSRVVEGVSQPGSVSTYTLGGVAPFQNAGLVTGRYVSTSGVRTVPVAGSSYTYTSGAPVSVSSSSRTVSSSSSGNLSGSGNLLLLKSKK